MVSFVLKNTLSDNGGVTRGVCKVNGADILQILWRRPILRNMRAEQPFTREKSTFQSILNPASMNMWGLTPEFFQILESGFEAFVANTRQITESRIFTADDHW